MKICDTQNEYLSTNSHSDHLVFLKITELKTGFFLMTLKKNYWIFFYGGGG